MDPQNWSNVKEVFYSALKLPETERSGFLDSACHGDVSFRSDVELLLSTYRSGFLEDPVWPDLIGADSEYVPFLKDGDHVGHYEIVRLLGRGGMGEVYLARDLTLDREIAIKVLHEGSGLGENAAKRLLREARSVARLDHPNICAVYEVGETAGRPFITMQYIEGETLHKRLKNGPVTLSDAIPLMRKISAALAEAHSREIIHRDIKPSNIIVDSRGQLRVLDFGLAKRSINGYSNSDESEFSAVGMIAGTVAYMSPEQARGQTIDATTDIWSLGVVFYQLLTGQLPYLGKTNVDTVAAILHGEYQPPTKIVPELPPLVDDIITRCLEPNIEERYSSIEEFEVALAALNEPPKDEGPRKKGLAISTVTRRRNYILGALVVLITAVTSFSIIRGSIWENIGLAIWPGSSRDNARSFSSLNTGNFQIAKVYSAKHGPKGKLIDLGFSPDGKLISFVSSVDFLSAIYVKQISGGEPIQITDGKSGDQTPVWSPDGERIAFISSRDDKAGVWAVSYMGGTPVLLATLIGNRADHRLKKWSRDGRHIYLESGESLMDLDIENGQSTQIGVRGATGVPDGEFAVSADETMIAYQTTEQRISRLWIQPIAGGDAIQMAEGEIHNWSPAWFPDGQRLAYSSDQNGNFQIYMRDINVPEPRQVTFGDQNAEKPVISPDGQKIGYIAEFEDANIYSYDIDAQRESILTSRIGLQLFPSVSPNGRNVAFQTTENGSKLYDSPLNIISLDGNLDVASLETSGCCVEWAASGNAIVYARFTGTDNNIWKLDIETHKESRITNAGVSTNGNHTAPYELIAGLYDWSPDGKSLAFTSGNSGKKNIWTVSADGSSERQITKNEIVTTGATAPKWSPSGNAIAFVESRGTKFVLMSKENRVAMVENDDIRYLSEPFESMRMIGWLADGTGVLFAVTHEDGVEIRSASVGGNGHSQVIGRCAFAHLDGIRLSPDRHSIVFSGRQDNVDNLFNMSISGGEISKVTANEDPIQFYSGVRWSSEGKMLFYSKQSGGAQISMISDLK